jgi:hypothetical protein
MSALFLHGGPSAPGGAKPSYLPRPSIPDGDFEAAVRLAQAESDRPQPAVVVGPSRGSDVAMDHDGRTLTADSRV